MKRAIMAVVLAAMMFLGGFADVAKAGATVYVTNTGKCYHRVSCKHLRRSRHAIDVDLALDYGYRPCKVCRPSM